MSAGGDYSRLHLRVKCFAEIGQFVGVQGFGLTKGDDHAIKLVTTPEAYPIWFTPTATPIVLPRGELVNYKYCLIEDGQVKAKEHVSNPRLLIPEEEDLVVEDEFRINETESKDVLDESSSARYKAESEKVDIRKVVGSTISKLFIVCYHLPVVISRTNHPDKPFDIEWAESLIARSAQGSISNNVKTIWIGTISIKDLTPAEKGVVTVLLRNMDCIPVFLDDQIASSAYYGFCKTIMWPVFHNVDQLDQIHAAWNLPEIQQESGQNNILQTLQKAYNPLDSPSSRNQSRKQRSQSSLEAESRVLEWNKKEEEYHESYKKVNQIFANTLLEIVQKTDVVWVHDYHLMLVPAILRAAIDSEKVNPSKVMNVNNKYKDVKIIFFLHIPFPTSQIFRTLPESIELLQSMAAADLVGFHAFDHARHFLNAARRLLGLRSHTRPGGMLTVSVKDREVIITMSHVSIETEFINEHLNHPETLRRVEELQQKYAGKKIILGIDVCQRLSGIALKMFAMEKLLSDYLANNPGNNNGIVLIQRSIRQGSRKEDEETTANDIRKLVSHLNTKFRRKIAAGGTSTKSNLFQSPGSNDSATSEFGSAPVSVKWDPSNTGEDENDILIDYAEVGNFKGLPIHERIALYLVSDIFLLTCIREGLNLLPLEYIYSRRNLPRGGVVIASEFSTCSNLLNGALKVNPFSPANVSDTILQALSLSNKDCDYRRQRDLPFIESHPSSKWTKNIVDELEQLRTQSGHGRTTLKKYPAQLNINSMLDAYANAAKEVGITPKGTRVFVFDYGGTLLVKEKFDIYMKQSLSAIGSGRKPSETTMNTLKKLSEDPLNIVVSPLCPPFLSLSSFPV
jgi:trehalose 6-phosphate synthase/phosphatase